MKQRGGTSDIPIWFYMLEVILQFAVGYAVWSFDDNYRYWCVSPLSNGFMNFGRAFVVDKFGVPGLELSSWPYVVNEVGSYWIVNSFVVPLFVDLGWIAESTLWNFYIVVGIATFVAVFVVPYNQMNLWHSIIAGIVGLLCRILYVYYMFVTGASLFSMHTLLFVAGTICGSRAAQYRFLAPKGQVLDRSKRSRWPWNLYCVGFSLFPGLMVMFR